MANNQLNIHQRILAIMSDISYIQKGPKSVNGQYRFTSHDQVTGAIHDLLVKHGVTAMPSIESCTQEGNRTTVMINMHFTNVDTPRDTVMVRFPGYGVDSGDKGPGKAISYACKYALLKSFNLETGEDPDKEAEAKFEPVKCQEFEGLLPAKTDLKKLDKFLDYCATSYGRHVEEIKKDACNKMESFLNAFNNWSKKNEKDVSN